MKKNLLLLVGLLMCMNISWAQESESKIHIISDAMLTSASPNGKWMVSSMEGIVAIFNVETKEEYYYGFDEGDNEVYDVLSIYDNGTAVGSVTNHPSIWTPKDKWMNLPIAEGDVYVYNTANCITDDFSIITGSIAIAKSESEGLQRVPVIWRKNNEGVYGMYEVLPCPEKDFLDRIPQGVDIKAISTDGNIIGARIVDYMGMYDMLLTWNKDSENKWTYEMHGEELIVDKDAKKPHHPEYLPIAPDAGDFFNDAERAKYDEAFKMYQDSLNLALNGEGEYPTWNPSEDKYTFIDVTTEDGVNRYNEYAALNSKYSEEAQAYNDSLDQFYTDLDLYVKVQFGGDVVMSPNGRYLGNVIESGGGGGPWGGTPAEHQPVIIDLEDNSVTYVPDTKDGLLCSITNDGTAVWISPFMESMRQSYIYKKGAEKSVLLSDYIKSKSEKAYNDIKNNLSFSGIDEGTSTEFTDSIITGTIMKVNGAGTVFAGFTYDKWNSKSYTAWSINLEDYDDYSASVIKEDKIEGLKVYPNPVSDILFIEGQDIESVRIMDLTGRIVYDSPSAVNSISVNTWEKGTYILQLRAAGKTAVRKIIVTK